MQLGRQDRLYRYRVPFAAPVRLGGAWHAYREGLLVRRAVGEASFGWGEIAPLPGFSTESLQSVISGFQGGYAAPGCAVPPSVTCGMEMALLQCQALTAADAGLRRRTLHTAALLWQDVQPNVVAHAEAARAAGYRAVKLKVGRRALDAEIRLVRAVRRAIGPDAALRLDANRAWSLREATEFAAGIAGLDVAFVEEPLASPDKLPAIARLMPVALDETLAGLSIGALAQHRYAAAVVIKPMLLGGPGMALSWAAHATYLGMVPVISAALETGIGLAGLMHVAGRIATDVPVGLDTYRLLREDVLATRLELTRPAVTIPSPRSIVPDCGLLTRIA